MGMKVPGCPRYVAAFGRLERAQIIIIIMLSMIRGIFFPSLHLC